MLQKDINNWFTSMFNLIRHTLTPRTEIPQVKHSGVRIWKIAWLLISASHISFHAPWVSSQMLGAEDSRGFLERAASFWYRPACTERRKAKSSGRTAENRKSCKMRTLGGFDIRPLDRYPSSHCRISLLPHPWLPIIERYCVTLPKHFHGRDTCIRKIT